MSSLDDLLARGYSESRLRVRYAETDQMGVVYHANYLVWFEVGRVDFIRDMGLDYKTMEKEDNAMIAVIEASARYKAPARYDDEILVRTSLAGVRGPVVRFRYSVVRAASEKADELLLCEGETTHIVVDRNVKKREMPEKYATLFRDILRYVHEKK
jgi:acyl-CoA thioester hydrolase